LNKRLAEEWDAAEAAIKHAELVSGAIVTTAVNELRYAGRGIVEGLRASNDIDRTKYFEEAEFHCRAAKSDAIDAQALYWMSLFDQLERNGNLPAASGIAFAELRATIHAVGAEIARSREKREGRAEHYMTIQQLISKVADLASEMGLPEAGKISADRTLQSTKRRQFWLMFVAVLGGIVASVAGNGLFELVSKLSDFLR